MPDYIIGLDGQRRLKPGAVPPRKPKKPKPLKPPKESRVRLPSLPRPPGRPPLPKNDLRCPKCGEPTAIVHSFNASYGRVRERKCEAMHAQRTIEVPIALYHKLIRLRDIIKIARRYITDDVALHFNEEREDDV